jgi:hypothetical protein
MMKEYPADVVRGGGGKNNIEKYGQPVNLHHSFLILGFLHDLAIEYIMSSDDSNEAFPYLSRFISTSRLPVQHNCLPTSSTHNQQPTTATMARSKRELPNNSVMEDHNSHNHKAHTFIPPNSFTLNTPLSRRPPKSKKIKPPPTLEAILVRTKAREIRDRHHERVNRIRNLAIETNRQFPCTVIYTTPEEARTYDDVRIADIKQELEKGKCKVYWADGTVGCSHITNHGVMGAGCRGWRNGYTKVGR